MASQGLSSWVLAAFLGLVPFLLGYLLSVRLSIQNASQGSRLMVSDLRGLLGEGDDMRLIDWGKALEGGPVRDFRVVAKGRTLISGGNLDRLPTMMKEGVHYHFPGVIQHSLSPTGEEPPFLFQASQPARPSPWVGGALFFLVWMGGWAFSRIYLKLEGRLPVNDRKASADLPSPPTEPGPVIKSSDAGSQSPYLSLRSDLTVREINEKALALFGRSGGQRITHILDLSPPAEFLSALQEGRSGDLPLSFPGHPDLVADLNPSSEGTFIRFRRPEDPKTP